MGLRKQILTADEIARPFDGVGSVPCPVILSPGQLAALTGLSVKTIYEWIAKGRLDGAFRKRGKHVLIWRDRAIDILFNGKEWSHAE
jgi:excisionase family DNA binding protein